MLKQFFCIWVRLAQSADLISLNSTLLMGRCYCNNVTVSASLRVGLLYAWLRLCQDPATWAQSEALAKLNPPLVTKVICSGSNIYWLNPGNTYQLPWRNFDL